MATDSCDTIGWEPNSRQLGVNLSVSKIIASINNLKRATLSPARLIGSRVSKRRKLEQTKTVKSRVSAETQPTTGF